MTIGEQTRQELLNCQAILRAAGAGLSDAGMVHKIGVDRPELLVSVAMTAVID